MTVEAVPCNGRGEEPIKYKYMRVDFIENGTPTYELSVEEREQREQNGNVGWGAGMDATKFQSEDSVANGGAKSGEILGNGAGKIYQDEEDASDGRSEKLRCGWCGWYPACLERFNVASWLLGVMCIVVLFQGMIASGLIGSSATSIERRFQLRSKDYGFLVSIYEATNIVFILFVTFVGGRGHKPRWIAIGCLIVGVGSLLFALPHFTTPPYDDFHEGDGEVGVCKNAADGAVDYEQCPDGKTDDGFHNYLYLFGAAQVLLALGSLPVYTLGIAVLDESVPIKQSGVYLGIYYALSTVGPALGYVVAGVSLTIFTDLNLPDGVDLSPDDPGWVGAWWIGFVMAGVAMILIAVPLGAYPRELPTTAKIRAEKECQAHANAGLEVTTQPGFGSRPGDLPRAIKYLVINPTFLCTTFAGCSDSLLITAFGVFLPKFIENQFSATATVATTIVGTCIVPGGAGGVFLGGWLLRRLKLRVSGMLKFCTLMTIVTTLVFPSLFLRCPQNALAGVTAGYQQTTSDVVGAIHSPSNLTYTCNADCQCDTAQYVPVCLKEVGLEFFTPCHAGCTVEFENGTYTNCSCAEYVSGGATSTVEPGKCSRDCVALPIFVVLLVILLVVMFMPMVPALNVTLRSVPETQRSMALGLQSVIARCLGSIPGPILFGVIIDSTCLQWQETCSTYGSCWLYHNENLAWRLVVLVCALKIVSGLMYITAWCTYKPASTYRTPSDNDDQSDLDVATGKDAVVEENGATS
ncbi:solute carrier organic anion transporter family member 4A1-like [Diadema antillarum]|uniref:solute carrier organic anion transporter family member 4A1-like n=1 Tax=Diadema antillarum TaxID=105358 RepID=UPI003A8A0988